MTLRSFEQPPPFNDCRSISNRWAVMAVTRLMALLVRRFLRAVGKSLATMSASCWAANDGINRVGWRRVP
jgi:hypothetical protein